MQGKPISCWIFSASSRLCANPAFWVGLLYDQNSLNEAYELISDFSIEEILSMREKAPVYGLNSEIRAKFNMNDLAKKVLKISKVGLKNRKVFDSSGNDESIFLESIIQRQKRCESPADKLIENFKKDWGESVTKIFEENMA